MGPAQQDMHGAVLCMLLHVGFLFVIDNGLWPSALILVGNATLVVSERVYVKQFHATHAVTPSLTGARPAPTAPCRCPIMSMRWT
jgi:hypothetical protein